MKKNMKMLVASLLSVLMIFSLAACGSPETGDKPAPGQSGGKTGAKDSAPAFVYVSSFREVENDNREIGAVCYTDKGFYTTSSDVVGRREPAEGEIEEWEGQFDIRRATLGFETFDGTMTKLEDYTPVELDVPEGHEGGSEMMQLSADENGNLAALYHVWENWNDAPDGITMMDEAYWEYNHNNEDWYLQTMDANGRELSRAKLDVSDLDWFWPNGILYIDGKILMNAQNSVFILNPDGSRAGKIGVDGWAGSLFRLRDGTPCLSYSDNMTGAVKLASLDPATGRVLQTWNGPRFGYAFLSGGGDYDLYYQSGINVYGYDLATEKSERLFDWLNVDVLIQSLSGNFTVREDGSIFCVTNNWDSKWENVTTEFVTVEKKAWADTPQKEVLTLACLGMPVDLQSAVVRFNRSSNVRVNVIDYAALYQTEDDFSAGQTKLTTEIMSGTMPDILALQNMPYRQLAAKGLLEDLYPYFDADSELSRDDFVPNILRAMEIDGKLYSTVTRFNIVTLAGNSAVVGSKPGWTVAELLDALNTMPQGCSVLNQYTTCGDILRTELSLDADYYVNWETGEVNFDSQAFIDLLNLAKRFPQSVDYANMEDEPDSVRMAEGRQLLSRIYLGSYDEILYNQEQLGGNATFIGYPTISGVGHLLNVSSGYAISRSCSNKQAAWELLRSFMTEKALENNYYGYGFPANRKLLEKSMNEAMTIEYEKDANGNYRLDDNGERIPLARYYTQTGPEEEMQPIYALTQEQADMVTDIINTTDKLYTEDAAVLDIVLEQAEAFFAGQKTAEEVAKLVQGKLSIYVNEQR